jgi:hypothetical protein
MFLILFKLFLSYGLLFIVSSILFETFGLIAPIIILLGYILLALARYPNLRYRLQRKEVNGRAGYLYVCSDKLQLLPTAKIGRESEKGSRLRSHRTAAPWGLRVWANFAVPDAVAAERLLHQRYATARVSKNNEWFVFLTPLMFFEILLLRLFGAGKTRS